MKNQVYQPSNPEQNINSKSPFIQHLNMPGYEEQEEWNYQEFLGLLQRRLVVIVGVATTLMTGIAINLILNPKPAEYESKFQMLIEPVNYSNQVVDIVKEVNPLSSNQGNLDYESQIIVLKSPELIQNSIKKLQGVYPYINYNYLSNSLRIVRVGQTKILEVRYRSQDPVESKAVLEQISQDYLEYSQEKRQTSLGQGLKYINRELPSIQNRVDQIQRELQIFQQKYNFISPESLAGQIAEESSDLTQKQQVMEQELAQARANNAFLQSEDGIKTLLDSYPVYQELNNELRQLDIEIISASTLLQDENPNIITLKERRNQLLPLIQEESDRYIRTKRAESASLLRSLEVNRQELQKNQQALEQQSKQLPNLIREYTEIQRRLQIATEGLSRFLSTRENLQIEFSQTEVAWQLIQAPEQPTNPVVSSSLMRDVIVGLAASIFLAIGAALIIDKLDNTYHNAWSLKERLQLPLLGTLPFSKDLQRGQLDTIQAEKSISEFSDSVNPEGSNYYNYPTNFIESLRVLYTNIQLLNSDSEIQSITLTSAMAGDGKSTIAFHLAQIAAAMGKRVLLVDADMRRPSVHVLSNLNNLWGLSNLITSNLPFEKVVRQLPEMNAVSIITAGPQPPDCAKLLSSEKMKGLMNNFHDTFDLVIYDAPPMVGLADASLIASQTDGLLMVARIDKTDRSVLERVVADLKIAPINILGVVANGYQGNINSDYYQQV
ncbi:polysaccharide biosynthesis tyrosine autokinase [Nodularia harveyana UHCC-0300]|uniref:Polysaccharide biosynthesis tyrosine autokinase n=1 Tax=Nodularia harveyana UHCC-0300 TaxID=2974287 RepID=A0ABU5UC58_9CYAN|nr:polysaccharide biosynthesis tyrosine autokinase [Nodularia harveyana]MEA5581120.1 polysaccharide biosynthesis tyrosine autokinase [Nodularia harveyana UHCC-0300]